jgi:hypothetical protein
MNTVSVFCPCELRVKRRSVVIMHRYFMTPMMVEGMTGHKPGAAIIQAMCRNGVADGYIDGVNGC